jgi:hypothetical protein
MMKLVRVLALAMLPAICLAPMASAADPDPYAIFGQARVAWELQIYPRTVSYDTVVDVLEAGTHKVERYTTTYDALADAVTVDPVSDYERAHPPSGRGINLGIPILGGLLKIGKPDPPIDFLGVPELAPNYSFGLAKFVPTRQKTDAELIAEIRAKYHDPAPTPTPNASSGLREIGYVNVFQRDYIMTYLGIESVAGTPAYHLGLQPVRDPHRFRLRELWIDKKSYLVHKLVTAGNFVTGPGPGVTWTVMFVDVGGARYIADERTAQPMQFRGLRYVRSEVRFENLQFEHYGFGGGIYVPQNKEDTLREPAD